MEFRGWRILFLHKRALLQFLNDLRVCFEAQTEVLPAAPFGERTSFPLLQTAKRVVKSL